MHHPKVGIIRVIHPRASGRKLISSWDREEIMAAPKSPSGARCRERGWRYDTYAKMKLHC